MLDLDRFTHLTFDCYGTLVDWEAGILGAVSPVLRRHGVAATEETILELYTRHETEQEAGPYRSYREVLRAVMAGIGSELGFEPAPADLDALVDSIGDWPLFPDTNDALARLKRRYRLVVLSNVDDALFERTARGFRTEFDAVITAEQVRSYKPALANFRHALERLEVERDRLLHVAQSLFHDHVPTKRLGLTTVWVRRASRRPVMPASEATPDLVVPDLASLAEAAGL